MIDGGTDQDGGKRSSGSRPPWEVAATKPSGKRQSDAFHRAGPSGSRFSSASSNSVLALPGMAYFPEAQLPRSSSRQRSLQNGIFGSVVSTGLPQMGQRNVA